MTVARMVIGTITGIPQALHLADASLEDLYEVADELQRAHNAVLAQALDVVALNEGYRIATEHRRASHTEYRGPAE